MKSAELRESKRKSHQNEIENRDKSRNQILIGSLTSVKAETRWKTIY